MTDLLAHPVVRAALTGLVSAAVVDFAAFRSWKSYEEARSYDWRVAAWRWGQGFISGALAGLGFQAAGV